MLFYAQILNITRAQIMIQLEELHPQRGAQRQDLRAYSVA